mgnify:FL=1
MASVPQQEAQEQEEVVAQQSRLLRSELSEYLDARQERRRLFPMAVLTGGLAGAVAVGFRLLLNAGEHVRAWLSGQAAQGNSLLALVVPLFCALAAGLSVVLVRRFAPEAAGSGIPNLEAVLRRLRPMNWRRLLPVKFFGGVLAVCFGGLALGREGPTVQMGGAVGDAVARLFGGNFRDRETLMMAGAGAGLAAAFNAPLAGLVFVLEEVQREFRPLVFGATLIACVIADVVSRLVFGQNPVFAVPAVVAPPVGLFPVFCVMGAVIGLLGVGFNRALLTSLDLFGRVAKPVPAWVPAALIAAVVGVAAMFAPEVAGGGHHLTERALTAEVALAAIPLWLIGRLLLTLGGYASGAPGGIFAPMLALGALIGLGFAGVWNAVLGGIAAPEAFAMVGMAAFFTAVVRAPLTGIVLIAEMTGGYALMLPLLGACLAAYAVPESLGDRPIYEALLERDLTRSGDAPAAEQPRVLTYRVHEEARFAHRLVRELGLPQGCILVSLRRGHAEQVPTAATRLLPGDRVTVLAAPTVENAAHLLHEGFEMPKRDEGDGSSGPGGDDPGAGSSAM